MKNFFKQVIVHILTLEASLLLSKKRPIIIAISGSVGKTTSKDAIYSAIKSSLRTRKSEKSFNSDIGVPLTVLGLSNAWSNPFLWCKNIIDGLFTALFPGEYPQVLVLETGIDKPGDMLKITRWVKPDIVVLTRMPEVPVHVEFFKSPAEVTAEEMKLVLALKQSGTLIYNADDTIIKEHLPEIRQKQIGFSRYLQSDFTARADEIVYKDNQVWGTECKIFHSDTEYKIRLKDTIGTQHAYALAAALAAAYELGVSLESATNALNEFTTPAGRMRIMPGLKSSLLIDDSYNSSPIAAEVSLQTLKEIKYAKRKIAVLGDMLELGSYSSSEHLKVGNQAGKFVSILFTVGVRARKIAEGALAVGMSEKNIFQYDEYARAARELQAMLEPGDVVLIKGSQSIRTEKIVEEVMNEPQRAKELLVRQDTAWQKKH